MLYILYFTKIYIKYTANKIPELTKAIPLLFIRYHPLLRTHPRPLYLCPMNHFITSFCEQPKKVLRQQLYQKYMCSTTAMWKRAGSTNSFSQSGVIQNFLAFTQSLVIQRIIAQVIWQVSGDKTHSCSCLLTSAS